MRVLVATWVLAVATAILALSGPVALFAWNLARRQDRERRQREHEQEMEDRILKNAGDRFVPKSQVAGVVTLGALGAVITFLAWLDAKKPKV